MAELCRNTFSANGPNVPIKKKPRAKGLKAILTLLDVFLFTALRQTVKMRSVSHNAAFKSPFKAVVMYSISRAVNLCDCEATV